MKQKTVSRPAELKGIAVNSGQIVRLTLRPAPVDRGIVFCRSDLAGPRSIQASVLAVSNLVRQTAISTGDVQVHLVEHVMSALHGCGIDNVIVEVDGPEIPIMDGSARAFVELIAAAGPVEQAADRQYYVLRSPLVVARGGSTLLALPSDLLRITCTSWDDRALLHAQHLSVAITPETYQREIASARTYIFREDAEALKKAGGIRGGSLDNCIVIDGSDFLCTEPLRFNDELVRHKILDLIGDVMLLGLPLQAHLVAVRPGHAINAEFTRALSDRVRQERAAPLLT